VNRFDSVGLWWEDQPVVRGTTKRAVRNVSVPHSNWQPHREFPNLNGVRAIGLDTETKDPELTAGRGPGGVRGKAQLVGLSVATLDGAWYWPLRHEYEPQRDLNQDPGKVLAWLRDVLASGVMVTGANLLYDLEMLRLEGVHVPGKLFDVQFAEALIAVDNTGGFSLDRLGERYLGHGKVTNELYQWCAASFGGKADEEQRANIWRAPPTLVGPYAEGDAHMPLQILKQQMIQIREHQLVDLFKLECELIPMLLAMRFRGVCIDEDKARSTAAWLREQAQAAQAKIPSIDVWANESIAMAFDREKLKYPRTEAGNPSFTKQFLEECRHPLAQAVLDVRLYEKAANPFVESYLLESVYNGHVYCRFHPLRGDTYGAVSGRFSSSDPNLQNIPARHPVIAPLLRSLFIPEPGCRWRRQDHNQIEYRGLAHYAVGAGADEVRRRYQLDPSTDYHNLTIDMIQRETGIVVERRPAKNINFGMVYGMGRWKLIHSLGMSNDAGERLYEAYHEASPYVKETYESAQRLANHRGYVRTILKRRRYFPDGNGAHTALNAVLQGTAADILKKGMRDIWAAGLCDVLGAPHLTVHDELDWSDPGTPESDEAFAAAEDILVHCVKLKVPLAINTSIGANWGEVG
jgi:DNA polymerase I-like protein with 3'-5' exonuclease and polymerase domains